MLRGERNQIRDRLVRDERRSGSGGLGDEVENPSQGHPLLKGLGHSGRTGRGGDRINVDLNGRTKGNEGWGGVSDRPGEETDKFTKITKKAENGQDLKAINSLKEIFGHHIALRVSIWVRLTSSRRRPPL